MVVEAIERLDAVVQTLTTSSDATREMSIDGGACLSVHHHSSARSRNLRNKACTRRS